jgi:hypothetical protein
MKDEGSCVFIGISHQHVYAVGDRRAVQQVHSSLQFFGNTAAITRVNSDTSHV